MLKIYNSLSRAEETFVPLDPPRVRMYVCGITVYDYCHLGHARMMIVFDMVQRWLRASGYQLTYVRNITDIDDRIIRRAAESGEPVPALTERFIRYMDEDAAALGVQKPDLEPRATAHVAEMLEMIRKLEERGIAYPSQSGDVNFAVRKFPGYGRLSGKSLEDLRAGERVEVDESKRDPLDFVLWKRAKQGEPFWQSPWGDGRPGWHIECSAMSTWKTPGTRWRGSTRRSKVRLSTPGRPTGMKPTAAASAKRWMTISIRPRRWQCFSILPTKSTARIQQRSRVSCARSAGCSVCWGGKAKLSCAPARGWETRFPTRRSEH